MMLMVNYGTIMARLLNHCNGAEGTLDFGDLLQIRTCLSGKGGNQGKPGTHPTFETNKQGTITSKDPI